MIILSCFHYTPSCSHKIGYSNDSSLLHRLETCKSIKELKQIHSLVIKTDKTTQYLQTQKLLYTKILSLCASFSPITDLSYIYTLFHKLPNLDLSVYNDFIRHFTSNRNYFVALLLYKGLVENGLSGDSYTYTYVLKACSQLLALRAGETVHGSVIKNGLMLDLYVVNTLMRFYGVCRRVEDARKVFDESPVRDLVSWTVLIQAYVDNGLYLEGIEVFYGMCEAGMKADEKLMAVVLSGAAKLGDLNVGRKLHDYIWNNGVNMDVFVGNALLDMYLKCGDSESARRVFKGMRVKNVVSWNSMILGLSQSGNYREAINVFRKMRVEGIVPDEYTLVGILNACANLGVLELGTRVHAYVDKNKISIEGHIGNALIDMYAKCGSMHDALMIFERLKRKDVYAYSTMIMGLAMHGEGELALKLFYEMCGMGIKANEVSFVGVLTACTHAGLVHEGQKHFSDMLRLHNIKPQKEHYGCMVDLLGRAGLLIEAYEFVKNMPSKPDKLIWGSLLGACRIHGNLDLAEIVMKELIHLEPEEDGSYVLMSNIYASEKKWRNVIQLRKEMKKGKIIKLPGCSSIELDGVVYEFRKGDKAHSKTKEVSMLLDRMTHHLFDSGRMMDDYELFYQY